MQNNNGEKINVKKGNIIKCNYYEGDIHYSKSLGLDLCMTLPKNI